ncbi:MAG: hypothetical protein C0196_04175 [Dictyoglomus turgidum]|nr:MAG: hypothetical protein C0196_04175 [Dictyoglomus turgidum]
MKTRYFKIILIFLSMLLVLGFALAQSDSEELVQIETEEFVEELEEVEVLNLIQNGDFESGQLSPWEVVLINIKDFNKYEAEIFVDYFMWARKNSEGDGGYIGIKQSLGNYDVKEKKTLKLSFDILVSLQELDSDGWAGGEYPANVELVFVDENNEEYVYKKCFILRGSKINYPENNVTEIDSGDFYHFEIDLMQDHEILENILSHPYLKEIRVGGSGWDFVGAVDNIFLTTK